MIGASMTTQLSTCHEVSVERVGFLLYVNKSHDAPQAVITMVRWAMRWAKRRNKRIVRPSSAFRFNFWPFLPAEGVRWGPKIDPDEPVYDFTKAPWMATLRFIAIDSLSPDEISQCIALGSEYPVIRLMRPAPLTETTSVTIEQMLEQPR